MYTARCVFEKSKTACRGNSGAVGSRPIRQRTRLTLCLLTRGGASSNSCGTLLVAAVGLGCDAPHLCRGRGRAAVFLKRSGAAGRKRCTPLPCQEVWYHSQVRNTCRSTWSAPSICSSRRHGCLSRSAPPPSRLRPPSPMSTRQLLGGQARQSLCARLEMLRPVALF